MKRLALGFFAAALAVSASCYKPDLSGFAYTCDEVNPYCPDGLECISGKCLPPGTTPAGDGGPAGPTDGLMAAAGCRSGMGYVLGPTAFACPGPFNRQQNPSASQLCATGYRLCTNATGIDLSRCKTLNGFFGVPINVRRTGSGLTCGQDQNNPYFAGCGRDRSTVDAFAMGQSCMGFDQAVDCRDDTAWGCFSYDINQIDQTSSGDGVLCCQ